MPQLNGQKVGPIGYGMMGLTWRPQQCPEEQAFEALRAALQNGANFWNGGEIYGTPTYNSLVLLERYFAKYPEDAERVVLSVKGGAGKDGSPDGSPENIRRSIDTCLAQLNGRKRIDIFECARNDANTPMKLTFDTIKEEYIKTGKIGGVSLSEVRAETIHEAVKHVKVVAVEVELSLWSTDIFDNGIAAACVQYDIPLIAYSPLGCGMLGGQIKSANDFPEGSIYRSWPRFQPKHIGTNLELVQQVERLAQRKNCTPAQLSISWITALTRRPGMPKIIIPIPGATTAARVEENSTKIELADEEMDEIDAILAKFTVSGARYPAYMLTNT